jgi:hypothetical protein
MTVCMSHWHVVNVLIVVAFFLKHANEIDIFHQTHQLNCPPFYKHARLIYLKFLKSPMNSMSNLLVVSLARLIKNTVEIDVFDAVFLNVVVDRSKNTM